MSTTLDVQRNAATFLMVVVALIGLAGLVGCDEETTLPVPEETAWTTIKSELPRDASPDVPPADYEQLTAGNHEFSLALLHELDSAGNLLISPLSIRTAFVMVYAGALGQTAAEMDVALKYGLVQAELHPAWNGRDWELADRNDPGDEDNPPVEFLATNAIWGRLGYPFVASYLDLLATSYGAGIHEIDFRGAPEASRLVINEWVAERTRRKVLDLLPEDAIDSDTAVVLTNALYFRAPWHTPFEADSTATATFHLIDGGTKSVQMLRQIEYLGYYEEEGCTAAEIPFRTGELSMVLIMPDAGEFDSFAADLDVVILDRILDGLVERGVGLGLPKFSFEYRCKLKSILQQLGMQLPFVPAADFSGMTQNDQLWIAEAYHKTFIKVDEKGTEAAAATAVTMVDTSIPQADFEFIADRPFLMLIRDRQTDTILFLGRVVDP
jgi:serine protease inhibitor